MGARFHIFQIARVDADGNLALTPEFDRYPIELEGNAEDRWLEISSTLEGYILRDAVPAADWGETDARGRLEFPNQVEALEQGLYLIMGQRHTQAGCEYEMQPFLVMLPTWDQIGDDWSYLVTVRPKFIRKDQTEQERLKRNVLKIWECRCDIPCHTEQIEIQLLRSGEVYDTVILSEENDWRYSWDDLDAAYDWQIVENVPEGYTVTITRTGITFLVTNRCQPKIPASTEPTEPETPPGLPQTGQLWWPVPMLLCSGLFLIVMGVARRRGENYGT